MPSFDIVSKNREAMDKIVDLLFEKETLDGDEFIPDILGLSTTSLRGRYTYN